MFKKVLVVALIVNNLYSAEYGSFQLFFRNSSDAKLFKNIVEQEFNNYPGQNPVLHENRIEYNFKNSDVSDTSIYEANSKIYTYIFTNMGRRVFASIAMLRN